MDFESSYSDDYFTIENLRLNDRIAKLQKEISLEKSILGTRNLQSSELADINCASVDRSADVEEQLRYLKDENGKLKQELDEARKFLKSVNDKSQRLVLENRRLRDAQAEASLLRQQVQAMRATIDKLPADEAAARIRIEVLEERLQDIQRQNFDLRRQLAGLTPERNKAINGTLDCEKCAALLKQKALQTKYMVTHTTECRRQIEEYRKDLKQMNDTIQKLRTQNSEMEAKYQKELKDAQEYRDLYRRKNETSAKWYKTQVEGFTNDIQNLKSKMADLEKCLLKVHMNSEAEHKQRDLLNELKRIANEAVSVANQVKRWRGVYE